MSTGPDKSQKRQGRKPKKDRREKGEPNGEQRADLIKAIDHPLRRRILRILSEEDKPLSPTEITRRLDIPLGAISYQTRVLRKLGAIRMASSRQVRGALEHFHVSMIDNDQPIMILLTETRAFDEGAGAGETGTP